jgi:hypothetical protein
MISIRPPLNGKLIQELTEWTLHQFIESLRKGKLDVRKIVCRLLREGQRTKQSQMRADTKRRPVRMPKGKKETPALSPRRNTSGIVGICPLIDNGVQLGWVAYFQKDGVQQRKRFRFSDFGDEAFAKAQAWRHRGIRARLRAAEDVRADARNRKGVQGKRAVKSRAKRRRL